MTGLYFRLVHRFSAETTLLSPSYLSYFSIYAYRLYDFMSRIVQNRVDVIVTGGVLVVTTVTCITTARQRLCKHVLAVNTPQ
jgi:hypothetical protein